MEAFGTKAAARLWGIANVWGPLDLVGTSPNKVTAYS